MTYDAIVVGARVAGAPTAMLLARAGHRVLLVDRASFPSDALNSTLLIQVSGVDYLRRWGVLDHVLASGCPRIHNWHVTFGPLVFAGRPTPPGSWPEAFSIAPRRRILDQILIDEAVAAGVEFRDNYTIDELVTEGGAVVGISGRQGADGPAAVERAALVIGADGLHSFVAAQVGADEYNVRQPLISSAWSYWSGLQLIDDYQVEFYLEPHSRGVTPHLEGGNTIWTWPTNDGQHLLGVSWAAHQLPAMATDLDANLHAVVDRMAPDLARRLGSATRTEAYVSGVLPRNYYRRAFGPGWALVGDAGLLYEFSSAHGIGNGFRQADHLAAAVSDGLSGRVPMADALAGFERWRDDFEGPYCDFTYEQTTLQPVAPEAFPVFEAVSRSQTETDAFLGLFGQTTAPGEFYSPEHLQQVMSGS